MKYCLLRGMQSSGKTTWAKQFVKENQDWKRVSRDDFRHMLSSYTFDDKNELIVTKLINETILRLIDMKFNLI